MSPKKAGGVSEHDAPAPENTPAGGNATHDPSTEGSAGPSRRRRWRPSGRPSWLAVFAALLVAVLSASALVAVLIGRPSDDELRDSALLAARTYTASLTTYDARTLDEDVARVQRVATGDFAEEYEETINGLREQLQTEQASSTGTVVGAGLESLDGDRATVLVAVNQELVAGGAEPRSEASRLRMVLERRDGSWLVSDVERL